jgi:NodT family efflux transporter outer membrane factor (OMF) lipoprotein
VNSLFCARMEAQVLKRIAGSICALSVLLVAGCTVGPNYKRPSAEVPAVYKEVGDWKPAQPNDQNFSGNWWEIFQDTQLNDLEAQVNVSNQNLKVAEAQYTQARALVRFYRADLFPTIGVNPTATRNQYSARRQPSSATFNGASFTDLQIPFELSYQVDVWGRVRRNIESYRAQAQASAADLATVNLSMHAELAMDYFQARTLDAEEQLLNSTVTQYEQALALIQSRFTGGIASDLEVQQAETQLETTRAQAIDVGVARAQYEHAVAVLVGKPPAEFRLPPLPLTMPPPAIPVGLPSQLLERRPDIAAAERLMAAANAQIGVAKAAYYPNITLGATGGFESGVISTLVSGPSILWSLGPTASWTLLDFGRRRAAEDQAIAFYDQNVANYRQTVLTGFQQVEDNVAALRILDHEAQVQEKAVVAAQKYLELANTRYVGGVTSYLEVTTAESAALSDEITAVTILGRRMVAAVTLVQALGGGWNSSELPQHPECCGKLTSNSK